MSMIRRLCLCGHPRSRHEPTPGRNLHGFGICHGGCGWCAFYSPGLNDPVLAVIGFYLLMALVVAAVVIPLVYFHLLGGPPPKLGG